MKDVVIVAGARPNFMKVAPIIRELAKRSLGRVLVHTGQHYDAVMSDVFFEQLGIPKPDVHLEVGAGTHGVQTGRIMIAFDEYLEARDAPPRCIVVVGDVNSTLACALVGVKRGIPVAHVEAGLRSFDRGMPEEINRAATDAICDALLVSEPAGLTNLQNEGIPTERIAYVGNVMIDTLVHERAEAARLAILDELGLTASGYALVTLHRPSNVDEPGRLAALVGFLERLAEDVPVVFPAHPRTRARLEAAELLDRLDGAPGVRLLSPLGYRENLALMEKARLVVSDSGGIQEETTFLGVPCVTLRPNTERPVTVTSGTNTVVEDLVAARAVVERVLGGSYKESSAIDGWDGAAAARVVDALIERYP